MENHSGRAGMLSCQQTQNVIDGKKRIILNPVRFCPPSYCNRVALTITPCSLRSRGRVSRPSPLLRMRCGVSISS